MLIFFQEIIMQLFLWMLRLTDGIMEIFNSVSGVTDVSIDGTSVNIIEYISSSTGVSVIFWCIFILSIGLLSLFTIIAICKNMLDGKRYLSSIVGKFFLALLGTMIILAIVIIGILISNSLLVLISHIFNLQGGGRSLSLSVFDACCNGAWINGYSINEVDIENITVRQIMGEYSTAAFNIWPTSWDNSGMIAPDKFWYVPAMIACVGVLFSVLSAIINLAKRIFEIVFLYIIMPISISTLPLDDGFRFRLWRETFVSKVVLAYGSLFSVNIFVMIMPIVTRMRIVGASDFANGVFIIFMIIGGAITIPSSQRLFSRLFGQGEGLRSGGNFLRNTFYTGRMVYGTTIGTTTKVVRGISHLAERGEREKKEKSNKYEETKKTNGRKN